MVEDCRSHHSFIHSFTYSTNLVFRIMLDSETTSWNFRYHFVLWISWVLAVKPADCAKYGSLALCARHGLMACRLLRVHRNMVIWCLWTHFVFWSRPCSALVWSGYAGCMNVPRHSWRLGGPLWSTSNLDLTKAGCIIYQEIQNISMALTIMLYF